MFKLNTKYTPSGDQPKAIKQLTDGINDGLMHQTLLGVTGSGKTSSGSVTCNQLPAGKSRMPAKSVRSVKKFWKVKYSSRPSESIRA